MLDHLDVIVCITYIIPGVYVLHTWLQSTSWGVCKWLCPGPVPQGSVSTLPVARHGHEVAGGGWELLTRPPGSKRWTRRCGPRAEQSSLYAHLSRAWENSRASQLCLHFQAGKQVDVQVLHSAAQALWSVMCWGGGGTMYHIS